VRKPRFLIASAVLVLVAGLVLAGTHSATPKAAASPLAKLNKIQRRLLSGFASFEAAQAATARSSETRLVSPKLKSTHPTGRSGCGGTIGSNVKVNQNCLNVTDPSLQGRGQAQNETAIAADPANPSHLIAGYNDYRRGDGNCYTATSRDGGRLWTDSTPPMGFTYGSAFGGVARQYWQAGGDTSVAWDSKGNAYLDCQMFMRGTAASNNPDQSSAVYLFRSTGNGGASFNFPARPVVEYNDVAGNGCALEDKPYMTIDNTPGSPFQDSIYVTWTFFDCDGTGYILEAHSTDYGETFSAPVVVSTDSSLCANTYGLPTPHGACNENQFSDPFVGPDGALYVAYDNYNNAVSGSENFNQVLLTKSTDGGATFSAPVLVGNFYDLPDCATYQGGQDPFRACVPEKGSSQVSVFRATNLPSGAVDPTNAQRVVVTYGSYINANSNESNGCAPAGFSGTTGLNLFTGVKTAGACNNKIVLSTSSDAAGSFTGTTTDPRNLPTVNTGSGQALTDQFFQWAAFTRDGKLAVSYFDRGYGDDETTGSSDISMSSSMTLSAFKVARVTSSSMPPPTQFPDAQGNSVFYGDYTGIAAVNTAHPLWMDTRNVDLFACGSPPGLCTGTEPDGLLANDQEIYTATMGVSGR
jgi:hypothetical protein